MIYNNILDAIGNTPLVQLNHMVDKDSARVLVKVEGLNVGGSIKTRTAYNMLLEAEKNEDFLSAIMVQKLYSFMMKGT